MVSNNYYHDPHYSYSRRKPSKIWCFFRIVFFSIIVLIVVISSFSYKVTLSQDSILSGLGRLPVIKQFRQLLGMENLQGELNDRINFLLLGQGGVGHEGPYLTDTIIFGSLKPSTGDVALISIPRDLQIKIENNGWLKINTANSLGETSGYEGGGAAYAAKIIGEALEQPIHYWLRVDFEAFRKTVDDLGGVEVCVDHSFVDEQYPTDDFLMQTVSFEVGCQIMDGAQALQYARSRHGNNGEGSDFARAARQQKLIVTLRKKIFSMGTLTSPQKIFNLLETLQDHVQTNVEVTEIPHFLRLTENVDSGKIKRIVLDNSIKGLLRDQITKEGAYVLVPRTGNLEEIRNLAKNIFIFNSQSIEPVQIVVLNGTEVEGWATETTGYLESLGFFILKVGNAPEQTYEKSVIYPLQAEEEVDKEVLSVLKKSLDANVTNFLPEFLDKLVVEYGQADYFVVLGCTEDDPQCQVEEEVEETATNL